MARNLATEIFTEKSDTAVSAEGWFVIGGATVKTLAGHDKVEGTNTDGVGILINDTSTLDTGAGNDVITGTGGEHRIGIAITNGSRLDTGAGNDVVTGTGGFYGIVFDDIGTLDTGDGNDVVTGTGGEYFGIGIFGGSILTGAGNDVVAGTGGQCGIGIYNGSILDTGAGNDVVDALKDGFCGNGTVRLGAGNDILKGFGEVNAFGGSGRDQILLGTGVYTISDNTITKGAISMNVSEFERIGGTKGNLFNFADGTLTVGSDGFATFA